MGMKIKFIINPQICQMPYSVARGTEAQRFGKAAKLSEKFIGELKKAFVFDDKITRTDFKSVLRQTIDAPINVEIEPADRFYPSGIGYKVSKDAELLGVTLPIIVEKGKILKDRSMSYIKRVQALFSRIYNPKIIRRELALFNVKNAKKILQFENKLVSKREVTDKELKEVLKGLRAQKKIDVLQLLRYRLKIAENIQKTGLYATPLDKSMRIVKSPTEHWKFDEKSRLLKDELLKLIQKERNKTKNSMI